MHQININLSTFHFTSIDIKAQRSMHAKLKQYVCDRECSCDIIGCQNTLKGINKLINISTVSTEEKCGGEKLRLFTNKHILCILKDFNSTFLLVSYKNL